MSRAKPKGIAPDTRLAWQEWVRSLSPDEIKALNHEVTQELRRRNQERKARP